MNNYSWGGIDKNNVYIDETNARMIRNFKKHFQPVSIEIITRKQIR